MFVEHAPFPSPRNYPGSISEGCPLPPPRSPPNEGDELKSSPVVIAAGARTYSTV
jgi:hypothetical protein